MVAGSVAVAMAPKTSAAASGRPIAQSPAVTTPSVTRTMLTEITRIAVPCARSVSRESAPPSRNATMLSAMTVTTG